MTSAWRLCLIWHYKITKCLFCALYRNKASKVPFRSCPFTLHDFPYQKINELTRKRTSWSLSMWSLSTAGTVEPDRDTDRQHTQGNTAWGSGKQWHRNEMWWLWREWEKKGRSTGMWRQCEQKHGHVKALWAEAPAGEGSVGRSTSRWRHSGQKHRQVQRCGGKALGGSLHYCFSQQAWAKAC